MDNKKLLSKDNRKKANKITKSQNLADKIDLCADVNTIKIIDIIVVCLIFITIKRYIIDPFIFGNKSDGREKLLNILKYYYIRYFKEYIIHCILFISLIVLLLKDKDFILQNIGITTFIVLIVSFFQQADELLMGAAFAAIVTYIFVRIKYKVFCNT